LVLIQACSMINDESNKKLNVFVVIFVFYGAKVCKSKMFCHATVAESIIM
jgi:hypothetical protein